MVEIEVSPCSPAPYPKKWAGLFEARVGGRPLCTSRQPMLDAARVLVAEGLDPDTAITMRHAGSAAAGLSARLGVAARFTVREGERRPGFGVWMPRNPSPVARFIGLNEPEAIPA
jgi:hypothetical protein